jgi:hypothetical protein
MQVRARRVRAQKNEMSDPLWPNRRDDLSSMPAKRPTTQDERFNVQAVGQSNDIVRKRFGVIVRFTS